MLATGDGSSTARSPRFRQAYSSLHGARAQAETVFVRGSGADRHPHPRVLEVGFGLGHNFRATLALRALGAPLEYLAFEFDPAPRSLLERVGESSEPVWREVLRHWGASFRFARGDQSVEVRVADVTTVELPPGWATAVYLDGFSPQVNPEVWTPELCARLARALAPGGTLATYSAAGHLRRALAEAGLTVEKRRGLRGKREFVVAFKP